MSKIYHFFLFIIQYCFYYLITPLAFLLYHKKYPWLICERGSDARDNGYSFFKYLHDEQKKYINVYYLINKHSSDYSKVQKLGKVVKYKSLKHWLLYRVAECKLSTHLLVGPGNYINEWFKHHKHNGINVFLQHGITHNDFPSNYYEYNGSDLFICGAQPEYEHISKNCHYPENNVVYTGFSRFDDLHNFETKNQILIMPTWRKYLERVSIEEFKQSKYFQAWDNLLKDKKLNEILESDNINIVFYIHYSLKKYSGCFTGYRKNIIIADFNNFDVQKLLKESKLLITDYSSVFFDFAYMRKPIIYYQFDKNEFYEKHYSKSYFCHEVDGFGDIVYDKNELVDTTIKLINNKYVIAEKYQRNISRYFPLFDASNSQRIFDAIMEKIIIKKRPKKVSKRQTYLIFTGDDYGRNEFSTSGVNEAYNKGYIQQASLMINRSENDLKNTDVVPKKNIVFHFNITEGYQSFDDTSVYAYSVNQESLAKRVVDKKSYFILNKHDICIIEKELKHQITKYKECGNNCVAFDSHGHVHNRLPIAKLIIPILNNANFRVARIPSNIANKHPLFDLIYKKHVIHLYRKNYITADYFCSCYNLIHLNLNKYSGKVIEIMTHPFISNTILTNRRDISFSAIKTFISFFNTKLIDYNALLELKDNGKHKV